MNREVFERHVVDLSNSLEHYLFLYKYVTKPSILKRKNYYGARDDLATLKYNLGEIRKNIEQSVDDWDLERPLVLRKYTDDLQEAVDALWFIADWKGAQASGERKYPKAQYHEDLAKLSEIERRYIEIGGQLNRLVRAAQYD